MAKDKSAAEKLRASMGAGLKAEEDAQAKRAQALKNKFGTADVLAGGTGVAAKTPPPVEEEPEPEPLVKRDSLTMPVDEYEAFKRLDKRAISLGIKSGKSSFIRAGIHALELMNDEKFAEIVRAHPPLKSGRRPKKK